MGLSYNNLNKLNTKVSLIQIKEPVKIEMGTVHSKIRNK